MATVSLAGAVVLALAAVVAGVLLGGRPVTEVTNEVAEVEPEVGFRETGVLTEM